MGFQENREESSEFFTVDLPPLRPFLTHEWNPAAQEFSAFDRIFRVEFSISREKKRDEDIVGRISPTDVPPLSQTLNPQMQERPVGGTLEARVKGSKTALYT